MVGRWSRRPADESKYMVKRAREAQYAGRHVVDLLNSVRGVLLVTGRSISILQCDGVDASRYEEVGKWTLCRG